MTPLGLRWWAEGRIDALLRYSDETLRALRTLRSDHDLLRRRIRLRQSAGGNEQADHDSSQTLELAARIRQFGIVPEFSFVVGNPADPAGDTRDTIQFIRRIKRLNPEAEIIVQHYIPTPHPDGMYGEVDGKIEFPETPEEWASERWFNFTIRQDPHLPWLPRARQTADRQFRAGDQFAMADHPGHSSCRAGDGDAAIAEQLAICAGLLRISVRIAVGAAVGVAAKAALESL